MVWLSGVLYGVAFYGVFYGGAPYGSGASLPACLRVKMQRVCVCVFV